MPVARHVVERQMPPVQRPEQHWLAVLHVPPRATPVARVRWNLSDAAPRTEYPFGDGGSLRYAWAR